MLSSGGLLLTAKSLVCDSCLSDFTAPQMESNLVAQTTSILFKTFFLKQVIDIRL